MDFASFIKLLGKYVPTMLVLFGCWLLWSKQTYLYVFIITSILSSLLNIALKLLIKEPTPANESKVIQMATQYGHIFEFKKYGMPSNHMQMAGFVTMFLTLAINNPYVTMLLIVVTFLSAIERYMRQKHNLIQLATGYTIGLGLGYLAYLIASGKIKGNIKPKRDEYGPL